MLALPCQPAARSFRAHVVPAGHYFMMGDSRDNSLDSSFVGSIPREAIVGKVTEILVSINPPELKMLNKVNELIKAEKEKSLLHP